MSDPGAALVGSRLSISEDNHYVAVVEGEEQLLLPPASPAPARVVQFSDVASFRFASPAPALYSPEPKPSQQQRPQSGQQPQPRKRKRSPAAVSAQPQQP